MYSNFLIERYRQIFPEDVFRSLNKPLRQSIRVNTLKADERGLVSRLEKKGIMLEKIPWAKHGYFVKRTPFSIGATTEYLLGYYFVQDATSMYACEVLDTQRGDMVLDMAAAPGGKTTYMAQLMENTGTVVSLEANGQRIRSLRSNISRMGVENVISLRMDAREVEELEITFKKILLDAPCTGTGTVFKNPEAAMKEIKDVEKSAALQKSLSEAAARVLAGGGTLVYSTCSFLPEENEFIVQHAIDNLGMRLENLSYGEEAFTSCYGIKLSKDMKRAKRFYPHIHGTQGFFIAKLRKENEKR